MPERTLKRYVPDARLQAAPPWVTGRPPTRREVWERLHYIHHDLKGHKPHELCNAACVRKPEKELERFCALWWSSCYVQWFNFRGWRKPPDWVEGDPATPEAIPTDIFQLDAMYQWAPTLRRLASVHRDATERVAA